MQKIMLSALFLLLASPITAQIKGTVLDAATQQPLPHVLVINGAENSWTETNDDGFFSMAIKNYPSSLTFKLLGKKTLTQSYATPTTTTLYLQEDDLRLDEVVVTAEIEKASTGSNIRFGKQAINLVQAQSLADVMQLIPGKRITESNLFSRQVLNLRSAIFSDRSRNNTTNGLLNANNSFLINNSLGVGYLVDDIPISVNGELAGNRTSTQSFLFSNPNQYNAIGYGLDLRDMALANIEDIEIISGISSAKYGDHNTGLVKITKAVGYRPYEVRTNFRGGSYGLTLTKGFELPKNLGFINASIDYLHANENPRNSLSQYNRLNFNSIWQYRKKGVFSNRLTLNYHQNLSKFNTEVTATSERARKLDAKGFRLNNVSKWFFKQGPLDQISWRNAVSYQNNNTYNSQLLNSGGEPVANSLVEGTFKIGYTPAGYTAIEELNNKPLSIFSQIDVDKRFSSQLQLSAGISLAIDDNFGAGTVFSSDSALAFASLSAGGNAGWRSINYNNTIPADVKWSAYTAANINTHVFKLPLRVDTGLRFDNYNGIANLSPRFNSVLQWTDKLRSRFGFGYFFKAAPLNFLYPGTFYFDYLLADFRTNTYSFAQAHTFIRQFDNSNLKASQTSKVEFGIDYSTSFLNLATSVYYNQQRNGFTKQSLFEKGSIPNYDYTFYDDKEPDYVQNGTKAVLLRYGQPTNALTTSNFGAELILNTKKISSINTQFAFSGAYRYTKTESKLNTHVVSKDNESAAWVGVHQPSNTTYKTLNSSITATHHIAEVGLILTLTAEQFWLADSEDSYKFITPFAYYDRDLNYHSIPQAERADPKYFPIRRIGTEGRGSSTSLASKYGNYHIKLSKQFDNGLRLSFFAVNFLNHLPTAETINASGDLSTTTFNTPLSFGANLVYQF